MCTVTFIPRKKNNFILTSNRDEAPSRKSLPPDFYNVDGVRTLFPKDLISGGTWIGLSEKSRLICVLNGGSVIHTRKAEYRKSRGLVAKDFLATNSIEELYSSYNFSGIEPFTMIIVEYQGNLKLFEMVLNETDNHLRKLAIQPRIWSSTTLYTESMIAERRTWFNDFISQHELDSEGLFKFHKTAGNSNLDYGVVMDRGFVKTTSRTQVEKESDAIEMRYENLKDNTKSIQGFKFQANR